MTSWLPTLKTATPEEGYDLAIKLSRVAVKLTQPDAEVRDRLRPEYAEDPDAPDRRQSGRRHAFRDGCRGKRLLAG